LKKSTFHDALMLNFQVITLFPDLIEAFKSAGLISRGLKDQALRIECINLRDHAVNAYGQVDDTPYGGGSGLVLKPESAVAAIEAAKAKAPNAKVVLFTPRGKPFDQALAKELVAAKLSTQTNSDSSSDKQLAEKHSDDFILLCPRYEGVDERVVENFVDMEVSLGDFILMGGEIPAMAFIEALARLAPGTLGNPDSTTEESFENNLLEYPQYTKPQEFRGFSVPDVLLSGNHAAIQKWRQEKSISETAKRRPDLLANSGKSFPGELNVALMHYPVTNKEGKTITSSITNIDLHDIARASCTYGLKHYYVAHPTKTLRRLAAKITDHWTGGWGSTYNPNRGDALQLIRLVSDFDDIIFDIQERTGKTPKVITTSARVTPQSTSFEQLKSVLLQSSDPHLIVLGTAWGLAPELLERADYHLEPICGPTDYNHLSVRSAASIIFDRLLGH